VGTHGTDVIANPHLSLTLSSPKERRGDYFGVATVLLANEEPFSPINDLPPGGIVLYACGDTVMMEKANDARATRLKRLRIRSWHRGTQEMDLLLGRFADAELEMLSDRELDLFEAILFEDDQDLYAWITGDRPWPTFLNNDMTARLTAFANKGSAAAC